MSLFTDGLQAYQSGQSSADCPYSKGSDESVDWHRGYELRRDYNDAKQQRPKWEYFQDTHCSTSYMNKLGNDGWELVSQCGGVYTFKRSKPQ